MKQHLALVALVVRDYDEAIAWYIGKLGFTLVEDEARGEGKRWVVVAPPGARESAGLGWSGAGAKRVLAAAGLP